MNRKVQHQSPGGHTYFASQLDSSEFLNPRVISVRWRRITFTQTTWNRFQMAQEINELSHA